MEVPKTSRENEKEYMTNTEGANRTAGKGQNKSGDVARAAPKVAEGKGTRKEVETLVEKNRKRLLLVMPRFHGYEEEIIKEAEVLGYETDFVDDRPSQSVFEKAILRLYPKLLSLRVARYCEKVIRRIENTNYDKVLVISGQSLCFDGRMLDRIRFLNPHSDFVLYQWDSLANFPKIRALYPWFDRIVTFDPRDAADCPGVTYLPLFCIPDIAALRTEKTDVKEAAADKEGAEQTDPYQTDLSYLGTAHPGRYVRVQALADALLPVCPRQERCHFLPSRLLYWYRRIVTGCFQGTRSSDFRYTRCQKSERIDLYRRSRIILDSPQDHQTGLTMRCIEAVFAGKKLITTNPAIQDCDFYRAENILVLNTKESGKLEWSTEIANKAQGFVKVSMAPLPEALCEKYSLHHWLETLLADRREVGERNPA